MVADGWTLCHERRGVVLTVADSLEMWFERCRQLGGEAILCLLQDIGEDIGGHQRYWSAGGHQTPEDTGKASERRGIYSLASGHLLVLLLSSRLVAGGTNQARRVVRAQRARIVLSNLIMSGSAASQLDWGIPGELAGNESRRLGSAVDGQGVWCKGRGELTVVMGPIFFLFLLFCWTMCRFTLRRRLLLGAAGGGGGGVSRLQAISMWLGGSMPHDNGGEKRQVGRRLLFLGHFLCSIIFGAWYYKRKSSTRKRRF